MYYFTNTDFCKTKEILIGKKSRIFPGLFSYLTLRLRHEGPWEKQPLKV